MFVLAASVPPPDYIWTAHPDLINMSITGLKQAVIWLCSIIGGLGCLAIGLALYIDRQRMTKMDSMAANIEKIADAITTYELHSEKRLTHLETVAHQFAEQIRDVFAIIGKGERRKHEDD